MCNVYVEQKAFWLRSVVIEVFILQISCSFIKERDLKSHYQQASINSAAVPFDQCEFSIAGGSDS